MCAQLAKRNLKFLKNESAISCPSDQWLAKVSPVHMSSLRRRYREGGKTTHNNDPQCFQMMDSLKSKASPPFKPHLKQEVACL